MELADDLLGLFTRLSEDAVPRDDLTVSEHVFRSQRSELEKRGFGRVRGPGDQRRTIHPSRLPSRAGPLGHSAKSLGQFRREPCETSNRIAEFDLPPGEPVQLGGFARRASSLT